MESFLRACQIALGRLRWLGRLTGIPAKNPVLSCIARPVPILPIIVSAVGGRFLHAIQNDTSYALPLELLACPMRELGGSRCSPNDQQHTVAKIGEMGRVCNRQTRRRIQNHPLEERRDAVQECTKRDARDKLACIRCRRASGN